MKEKYVCVCVIFLQIKPIIGKLKRRMFELKGFKLKKNVNKKWNMPSQYTHMHKHLYTYPLSDAVNLQSNIEINKISPRKTK